MDNGRVHLVISGYVQGVFFRASTRDMAIDLGLNGWVKNLYNGKVEAVFEGPEDRLREAVSWCHEGPPGSRVTGINEQWEDYSGEFSSFSVLHT